MTPKEKRPTGQQPLLGSRLEFLIDLDHELVRLAQIIPWDAVAQEFRPMYAPGNGRPAIATRLMAGLHLLKHTYGLSDEQVVVRWTENPYWQFFCGEEFFQHRFPIHPSQMTRWRQRIGQDGCEKLLQLTIEAGKKEGTVNEGSFDEVIVDTTVQPKAVAHPTDARLYRKAHRPYEFGVKVSVAVTHKEGFVVGIQTCPENPYDGHTLDGQLDQVERLVGKAPAFAYVDRGYKGHGVPEERSRVLVSGTRRLGALLKRQLRRRAAVEPEIGHLKSDGLLGRNFLKGMAGDVMNALLCGAGHNLRKIMATLSRCQYQEAAA